MEKAISEIESTKEVEQELAQSGCSHVRYLSEKAAQSRRKFPTVFKKRKLLLNLSAARKRRKKTFALAPEIHGGSVESLNPGAFGVIDTVLTKCSSSLLADVATSNKK